MESNDASGAGHGAKIPLTGFNLKKSENRDERLGNECIVCTPFSAPSKKFTDVLRSAASSSTS
jgi:hypothetical protein